uniref:Uncharacterized protein n=1 Tax=Palpitomonas bilix TaxID=652834 RepID=A0A7S3D3I5_9EUKA|mmetsp:Transcript_19675/g.50378  ORF Transcript_19675/g.50378 Transcript_19675/m.50378 type:complete len:145 (+) Transcript_19675:125-559(+)
MQHTQMVMLRPFLAVLLCCTLLLTTEVSAYSQMQTKVVPLPCNSTAADSTSTVCKTCSGAESTRSYCTVTGFHIERQCVNEEGNVVNRGAPCYPGEVSLEEGEKNKAMFMLFMSVAVGVMCYLMAQRRKRANVPRGYQAVDGFV